jgi:hypothetical protein
MTTNRSSVDARSTARVAKMIFSAEIGGAIAEQGWPFLLDKPR